MVVKTSVVEAYKIPSSSMEDTLEIGDFLLANKFIYGAEILFTSWRLPAIRDPKPGDVVIFIFPGDGVTKYIKRCVAVAGDTVQVRDKQLYVNGQIFENPLHSKFTDTAMSGERVSGPLDFENVVRGIAGNRLAKDRRLESGMTIRMLNS